MDKKRFVINLMSNFLSALSGLGLSFFLTPYLVETLGKEAYGFYPLSNNFIMYTGIITTALNSMAGRYITISLEQKDIRKVNVYFNSVLFGNILISMFFVLLGILVCFFIDAILHVPVALLGDIRLLFILIFLGLIINVSSSVFSVAAFAVNRLDKLAVQNIIVNILKLTIIIVLFYFCIPRIYFLGVVTVITSLYFFYANYKITRSLLPEVYINISLFSRSAVMLLVGSGIWNSILALSNVINTQLDLLIANHFYQASGMGTLSLTKFVPTTIQLLLGIIVPVFLPEMIKAYAQNNISKLKEILNFSFKAIFLIVLVPLSVFIVYGDDFFRLWLPGEDHLKLYYISVLTLIPFIIHATIETVYHVFVVTNKLRITSFFGMGMALFNFILALGLCYYSQLGIYSIPVAALISGCINHLIFTPLYASYCLQESRWYFISKIIRGLLGFTGLLLITYVWKSCKLIYVASWEGLIINVSLTGFVLSVTVLFLRFDRKILVQLFQKFKKQVYDT
ncbi:lipopolysaccharide biosynthesis protein [Sphingobacterium spiritivorum]|uniref:lipopolysaccharide biosynthesis protein n=1 Tax=Sphingobacterium spiritivorum TaxID=258 RepID=UPI003DA27D34